MCTKFVFLCICTNSGFVLTGGGDNFCLYHPYSCSTSIDRCLPHCRLWDSCLPFQCARTFFLSVFFPPLMSPLYNAVAPERCEALVVPRTYMQAVHLQGRVGAYGCIATTLVFSYMCNDDPAFGCVVLSCFGTRLCFVQGSNPLCKSSTNLLFSFFPNPNFCNFVWLRECLLHQPPLLFDGFTWVSHI
jgi:hypothetical protein